MAPDFISFLSLLSKLGNHLVLCPFSGFPLDGQSSGSGAHPAGTLAEVLTMRCAALVLKVVAIFLSPSLGISFSDCGKPGLDSCSHLPTVCLLPALQGFCRSHLSLWDPYSVVTIQETLCWEERKERRAVRAGNACAACKAWNQNWGGEDRKGERGGGAGVSGGCQAGPRPGCCAETPAFSPECL